METTTTENTPDASNELGLKEALSALGSGGLSEASLHAVARAAFLDRRGRDELDATVQNWSSASGEAGLSGSDAKVVHGYLEFLRGHFGSAVDVLGKESSPWAVAYRIRALLAQGKKDLAVKAADKADHGEPVVGFACVEALCASGRGEDAVKIAEGSQSKAGDTSAWHCANGRAQQSVGEYRAAIDAYRQCVALDRENAEGWFRLGFMLDLHGNPAEDESDEAVRSYEVCLNLVPLHTNAIVNLGLIYEDRERYHDAIKCYEAVLRVYPNHGRAKLYLGDAIAATQMFYDRDQEKKADRHSQILKIPVTDFELSVRSRNCLQKMKIDTLGDLIMKTEQELLSYKNFGETSLKEIREMLTQKGLRLGQGLEDSGGDPPSGRNPLEATAPAEVLDQSIDELNLSVRSRRCMERLEVRTVRDLINKTEVELMSAKNFGMTSLNEIKRNLAEMGLSLRS